MNIGILAGSDKDRYVFKTLFDTLGLGYQFIESNPEDFDAVITHGEDPGNTNSIIISDSSQNSPHIEWVEVSDRNIPIFFSTSPSSDGRILYYYKDSERKPAVKYRECNGHLKILLGPDIIASTYYLLTLSYEEYNDINREFVSKPIVTEYMSLLFKLIGFIASKLDLPILQKFYWPDNQPLAVCLTHDIDFIGMWWFNTLQRILELLKESDFNSIISTKLKAMKALTKGKNPFFNFNEFISLEQESGFKSTFFFLTEGGSLKKIFENRGGTYNLEGLRCVIQKMKRKGWDVGLHGSINSYKDYKKFKYEKQRMQQVLGSEELGVRQHFLRFEPQSTWKIQEKCGLMFDTTLGYPDKVGFRGGFSFPFFPYNTNSHREFGILEIPLTIMDRTFTKYIGYDDPLKVITEIINETKKNNGLCTILWHNSSIDEGGFPGYLEIYRKTLELIKSNNGWGTSAKELTEWWIKRKDAAIIYSPINRKKARWTFCPKNEITTFTLKIHISSTKLKKVKVEGAINNCETYKEFTNVRLHRLTSNSSVSIMTELE